MFFFNTKFTEKNRTEGTKILENSVGFVWFFLVFSVVKCMLDFFFTTKSTEKNRTEVTEIIEYDLFFGFEIKQQFFSRTESDKKKRQKKNCRFFLSLLILNFYFEKKWMKIYFFLARDVGEQQS